MRLEDRRRAVRNQYEDAQTAQKIARQARVDGLIQEAQMTFGDAFVTLLQKYAIESVLEGDTTPVLRIATYMNDPYLTLLLYPGDIPSASWRAALIVSTPQQTDIYRDTVAVHSGPVAARENLVCAIAYLEAKAKDMLNVSSKYRD